MKVASIKLKRGQWRAKLEDYKPVLSDQSEFKAKIWGRKIEGIIKHKPNGKMKVYEDSNGDGIINKGDDLIVKGKVEKEFRGVTNPLDLFEIGSVKQKWETVEFDQPAGLGLRPVMEFKNSDGDVVAKLGLGIRPFMPIVPEELVPV